MNAPGPQDAGRAEHLHALLAGARWFGGKDRPFTVSGIRRIGRIDDSPDGSPEPVVIVELVEASYADGTELYQVPLALYTDAQERLEYAFVGWWEDADLGWVHAYDAVQDRQAMARYLAAFLDRGPATDEGTPSAGRVAAEERGGVSRPLTFVRTGDHALDPGTHGTLFSGEQSNSSVLYGDDAVLKVFRRLTPGENPDITTHRVLTDAGSPHVATLYGWVEAGHADGVLHLAMLQEFLRTASDGWELALASVRDLFSEADLHADEVGGDFAAEAARLGVTLAEVHDQLRAAFPRASVAAAEVARAMTVRLDRAIAVVPELAEHADRLRGAYAAVADLGELTAQRIHGDLHLGQTLRTVSGWKLVDFEGEPAKPLAERQLPDSPWRDVAGMLRSFDYAPHAVARSQGDDEPDVVAQREHRAEEWAARNKAAFLRGYAEASGTRADGDRSGEQARRPDADLQPPEGALVAAYVADKAVYECVYEARNRPSWLAIPLTAVASIGTP